MRPHEYHQSWHRCNFELSLAACTVAVVSVHMAANLPKSTSDDSHLAGDSKQSENKHFAGMAAEVTEGTSDDSHLAGDSKQSENKHFAGMAAEVTESSRIMAIAKLLASRIMAIAY